MKPLRFALTALAFAALASSPALAQAENLRESQISFLEDARDAGSRLQERHQALLESLARAREAPEEAIRLFDETQAAYTEALALYADDNPIWAAYEGALATIREREENARTQLGATGRSVWGERARLWAEQGRAWQEARTRLITERDRTQAAAERVSADRALVEDAIALGIFEDALVDIEAAISDFGALRESLEVALDEIAEETGVGVAN